MNATYSCGQCGMSVKAQCASCDVPLENGHLDLLQWVYEHGCPVPEPGESRALDHVWSHEHGRLRDAGGTGA